MPTEIRSPMPGKIIQILKNVGDQIGRGEPIMMMEAMKMEMPISATISGTISDLPVQLDKAVAKNDVLVVID